MRDYSQHIRTSLIAMLTVVSAAQVARAEVPGEAIDAYIQAYTAMGKRAAMLHNQMNAQANLTTSSANARANLTTSSANARATLMTASADAQTKMMAARTAWLTAVANAQQTRVKTLQSLEELRGQRMDNELKYAKTFYDKRKLHATYKMEKQIAYQVQMQGKRNAYLARKDVRPSQYASRAHN